MANPEETARAVSVNHIAISVSDLECSAEWYCSLFSLRVIQRSDESVLLGFGESMLVLREGPNPGTISHFMLGVDPYNEEGLKAHLLSLGWILKRTPTASTFVIPRA
jgi:catechol 2,3-dioxygenase-like lactoylglutathione lyase family enzyme